MSQASVQPLRLCFLELQVEENIINFTQVVVTEERARMKSFLDSAQRHFVARRRAWGELMHHLWPKTIGVTLKHYHLTIKEHWMLDPMENSQRKHKRLKTNIDFDAHADRVPVTRAELTDDSSISIPQSSLPAPVVKQATEDEEESEIHQTV